MKNASATRSSTVAQHRGEGARHGRGAVRKGGSHGGASRPRGQGGGGRGGGRGEAFVPLPETTRTILERCRRDEKLAVHPGLEIGKFVVWNLARREVDREACFQRVIDAMKRLQPLAEAWRRRRSEGLSKLGRRAKLVVVEAQSPCVLWLGAPTPLELGFCLHHTYGLPYLPGSGLKGVARRAAALAKAESSEPSDSLLETLFGCGGDSGRAGAVDFLDGIPLKADCLALDVMSPHHPKYYQGSIRDPHDCEDPVPLPFLRIVPGSQFEIALLARGPKQVGLLAEAEQWLSSALHEIGVGGKTSSGYGLFVPAEPRAEEGSSRPLRFLATIRRFDRKTDRLELLVEETRRELVVSLGQALQRGGLTEQKLNRHRKEGTVFEVEMDEQGSLEMFLPRKD